jgi:outer membrane receptor protein involved in Fe transport
MKYSVPYMPAAILILSLASPVGAQNRGIEEIKVVGRRVNLVGDASSASEGLVSHAELEIRPILRTGEILETVPGMVATQHSGSGKANQYFLRGFNLDHGTDFATFVDKMPVNMRTHGHGQGYTDLNFVIPEMVEEIFYQKGSYYANIGDFSGTGAGYIRSISHADGKQLELGLGEDGFQRMLATAEIEAGGGDLFYGIEVQGYDGPWTDIDENVEKKNLWLKQQWKSGDDLFSLTFMGYDNSWNSADQIPKRAIDEGIISDLGSIDTSVGGDSSRYSVSTAWYRENNGGTLDAAAYLIDYDLNLISNFSYFTDPAGDQFKQVDDRTIFGWDIAYTQDGKIGDLAMRNIYGTQLRYDQIDEVGLLASQTRTVTGPIRTDAVDEWSTSLYWQNQVFFSDQLRSTLGLRYSYFDFEIDPISAGDPVSLALNGGSANDDIITATWSLSYAMNDRVEFYGSIGEGFHSNDARGTTIQVDPTDSSTALNSVDPLVPTLGFEIGTRLFLGDKLNASVALWRLKIDSELIFVGDEGGTEDTGESSTRDGIELTAYWYINDVFTLDFEYSYTDSVYDNPVDGSNLIAGALETVFSAGLNANLGRGLYTNLRLRHFGDYPLDGGAVNSRERADASTLVNLRVGYQANDTWSFSVDVLNLLDSDDHDVEYFYESQLATETAPVEDHHFHVFEPRTVRAYVSYRF